MAPKAPISLYGPKAWLRLQQPSPRDPWCLTHSSSVTLAFLGLLEHVGISASGPLYRLFSSFTQVSAKMFRL